MRHQRGSALIISLLILLVMTIIGISAMSSSTLEERMAANDRNQKVVFQSAETTLVEAETTLAKADYNSEVRTALLDNKKGYYSQDDAAFDYFDADAWDPASSCISASDNSCYVIEESSVTLLPGEAGEYGQVSSPERGHQITKITVRSTDPNENTAVILQSSLQKTITY